MEGQAKAMKVKEWIYDEFCKFDWNIAKLLARRAFTAGYNTALENQGAFVFDGRRMVATPEARTMADKLFDNYLDSDTEGRVK